MISAAYDDFDLGVSGQLKSIVNSGRRDARTLDVLVRRVNRPFSKPWPALRFCDLQKACRGKIRGFCSRVAPRFSCAEISSGGGRTIFSLVVGLSFTHFVRGQFWPMYGSPFDKLVP